MSLASLEMTQQMIKTKDRDLIKERLGGGLE
jgi:hypothetical protein